MWLWLEGWGGALWPKESRGTLSTGHVWLESYSKWLGGTALCGLLVFFLPAYSSIVLVVFWGGVMLCVWVTKPWRDEAARILRSVSYLSV